MVNCCAVMTFMKTLLRFRLLACIVAIAFCSTLARAEVVKIVVDDTIQPITAEYISRAIDEAVRSNAQAVLIEVERPTCMPVEKNSPLRSQASR